MFVDVNNLDEWRFGWRNESFHLNFSTTYSRILGKINFIYRSEELILIVFESDKNLKLRNLFIRKNSRSETLELNFRQNSIHQRVNFATNYFQFVVSCRDNRWFFVNFFVIFEKQSISVISVSFFFFFLSLVIDRRLISDNDLRGWRKSIDLDALFLPRCEIVFLDVWEDLCQSSKHESTVTWNRVDQSSSRKLQWKHWCVQVSITKATIHALSARYLEVSRLQAMARHQKMPFPCPMFFFFFFLRSRRSRFFSLFQIFDTRDKKKFEINDNKITIFIKIKILLHYSFSRWWLNNYHTRRIFIV